MCHYGNTGVEQTPNESQHTKLTLEKKILLPLLPGFELALFWSRVRRSNQQAIPAPKVPSRHWQHIGLLLFGHMKIQHTVSQPLKTKCGHPNGGGTENGHTHHLHAEEQCRLLIYLHKKMSAGRRHWQFWKSICSHCSNYYFPSCSPPFVLKGYLWIVTLLKENNALKDNNHDEMMILMLNNALLPPFNFFSKWKKKERPPNYCKQYKSMHNKTH